MGIKKILYSILTAAIFTMAAAVVVKADITESTPQQKYIDKYACTAVREMYRSGVPASITLAQGLLESRFGLSALAAEGHNHFGIKCHNDWKGKTMFVDDDKKGECFRVYEDDSESFKDHSDFLRYRDRYKFLFDFPTTDYKAWAQGLSKAGYATDPNYPAKLIKNIEEYGLNRFDSMKPSDFEVITEVQTEDNWTPEQKALFPEQVRTEEIKTEQATKKKEKKVHSPKVQKATQKTSRQNKATKTEQPEIAEKTEQISADVHEEKVIIAEVIEEIPKSPSYLEEVELVKRDEREEFRFSLSRKIYQQNGVAFVYSIDGETYSSIAEQHHLFLNEILKINDLKADTKLEPGTAVYIEAKKNQAKTGLNKYIVETDGENLRDICQRFAVKKSSIMKLNGFDGNHTLREGDTILLRKP